MGVEIYAPDGIRFYVRDSGIGISNEKKSKVFMRFETLDEFAQGTELLSICKAIAESMGGSVGGRVQRLSGRTRDPDAVDGYSGQILQPGIPVKGPINSITPVLEVPKPG